MPLKCELVGGFWDVSCRKEFGDAEHLFEMVQVHVGQSKEFLRKAVIASRGHVDVLEVSWFFVIEYLCDKQLNRLLKILFFIVRVRRSLF